ncbi:Protein NRT1/ PTR FAMILY 5.7 [Camellia lanceoleosa]|uniref:Protein NRT1/ PTR FAMILY 5.7 n=1 Tax=Camellia lanceoleosa TaxID=1840588 RepID=A0ACC0GRK9_9ERIC|nr:Protein NRT1/ PTR FAMILY 5.7 [Camellia lanceoleosa]
MVGFKQQWAEEVGVQVTIQGVDFSGDGWVSFGSDFLLDLDDGGGEGVGGGGSGLPDPMTKNRMAVYVLNNLVTFLTHIWKLKLKHAVAIMNIKGGAAGIMGLVEAALIDAYLGYAGMLLITNVLYNIGLGFLVMSVPNRFFSKGVKSCPAGEKLCSSKLTASPFYWGLALIVLAKAGQGICLRALTFGKIKFKRGPPETKGTEFNYGNEDQTPQGQGHNQKTPRGPKKRTTLTDHCQREDDEEEEDPHEEIKTGKKQDKVEPTPDEETDQHLMKKLKEQ